MARKKKQINVDKEYLKAYYANEADANKQMSFANAAAGVYMLVIWIFYLTDFFKINSDVTRLLINIAFPIGILVLISPLLYVFKFKKQLEKPNYKYFVLFSFVFVIAVLNAILPKHSIIAWALCIIMTNHYFNPKVGTGVFISVIIASIIAMYASMFVGEFDANLLLGNDVLKNGQALYADRRPRKGREDDVFRHAALQPPAVFFPFHGDRPCDACLFPDAGRGDEGRRSRRA